MKRDETLNGLNSRDGIGKRIGVSVYCRLERGVARFRIGFECCCILGLDLSCVNGGEVTGKNLVNGRDCSRCRSKEGLDLSLGGVTDLLL